MFGALAHIMYRRRWTVLGAWLVALIVAGIFAAQASSLLGAPDYGSSSSESGRAAAALDKTFHQNGLKTTLVILSHPTLHATDPSFRQVVATVTARLHDPSLHMATVDNPLLSGNPQGISKDRHAVLISATTTLTEAQMEKKIPQLKAITVVPGFTTRLTGYSVSAYEGNGVTTRDLTRAEAITVPILLAVLLFVFAAVIAAGIPFLIAIIAITLAMGAVWVAAHFMSISVYVIDIVSFIGLGIAIDYSLFIVSRFREELRISENDVERAVVRTMETTGRAVFFSGLAVAVGLSSMILTGLSFMQAMGLGGMLIPISTVLVTLTLLPALLGVLGTKVNRFRVLPPRWLHAGESGIWHGIAATIMRRPWLAGGAVLGILLALSAPVARITLSQGTLKQSQGNTPAVAALEYLRTEFNAAPDPFEIVIQSPHRITTAAAQQEMAALETRLRRDPEVAQVFGPPDIRVDGASTPAQSALLRARLGQVTSADGRSALITVTPKHDSTSAANMDGLRRIRAIAHATGGVLAGATVLVGGSSSTEVDFDTIIIDRLPFIALIVLGLTYAFLFVAFRSVFLPLKAVLLNVLSVLAAFGMVELVFQQGYGVSLLGGSQADGVPTWVLLFLFAFLFGLSMDYEVLLLSRIRESWLRTNDNTQSVAGGMQATGRLISSAAVIMAIAFSGFVLGTGLWMKEMGLGLTVSILLDATLIRLVLVPSIMKVMGAWNWWVPGPLRAWSRRGGIEGEEAPEPEREAVLA